MADIKTREVIKGSVKTLDRAASATHRIKEASVRVREYEFHISEEDNDGSSGIELMAGDVGAAATHVVKSGTERLLGSREQATGYNDGITEATGNVHADSIALPDLPDDLPAGEALRQKAAREHAVTDITGRKKKMRMAEEEVLRSGERSSGIRQAGEAADRGSEILKKGASAAVTNPNATDISELMHIRGKGHAIKRITGRGADNGGFGWIERNVSKIRQRRKARRAGRGLREALKSSKALFGTLSAGGTVAVGVIIVMVFFGAALNMTEDGSYINGAGDGNIVEVAREQIGNVGGDKFWKWYGFNSHVHWCACFVSWCGDQCGYIEDGIIPKFAVVGNGASWFKSRHRWSGRGYSPHPGDIIFFDYEQDGVLDHVGIVESCDGKTVVTIEGNSGNACKRQSYVKGSSVIAGYGCPAYQTISFTGGNASVWAAKIAADNSYHYVNWVSGDEKTHQCPICHNLTANKYRGWNCIGFAFACWRHGYGINCNCNCGVIDDGHWNKLLQCKTDAEANRMATKLVGVPCVVIRNGGKAIPVSMLKSGDIIGLYNGSTYFHTAFYEGNGKYADCTSGRSDNIQSNNTISKSTRSKIKVAIRYAG